MTYYYFIRANDAHALESAPIFRVRVGKTQRAAALAADLSVRALQDDSMYFCIKSDQSQIFVRKLLRQNPFRAFYDVTIVQLNKMLKLGAMVADVENLSELYRCNRDYMLRNIRGANTIDL